MNVPIFNNYIWKVTHKDKAIENEISNLLSFCADDKTVKSHVSSNSLYKHGTHSEVNKLQIIDKYEDTIPSFVDFLYEEIGRYIQYSKWRCVDFHISQSWINLTDIGVNQDWHNHASGHISGVYYHDTVIDNGGIIFKNPNPYAHVNIFPGLSEGIHYFPEPNTLFLFPSWMEHKTDKNKVDKIRTSIS